ncbi:RNA 2',3'-cyclic phosphodiesterase [Parahaliea mediterranea]|uniref:RNA 2',3'-cyclic phosphodiesterase n=1 Tax=Parahaliea mediterranea TaxID=651086 RepID=A0A939DGJ5_9GAMM|nr:RNA 2',3'-cyclic phosphodiesterase [Parahaliea mediterranea]MBN7797664.1 RNA 2',3'-cyclic phosphodiesterase [Parahaliea mediterranea]
MRVFFGIELDQATALAIGDWRDRQFSHWARPVPVANFHITLAFAGELSDFDIDTLCLAVDEWVLGSQLPGAALELNQTGFWPAPGLYWLGPSQWPESLDTQASRLRHLVSSVGARRERKRFQPHITLFRRCDRSPPMPAQPPAFTLDYRSIVLFESRQQRDGVSYHALREWPLAAPGRKRP